MSAADGGERTDITGAEDRPLVDDDGYPTEWGIAAVRHCHGSPTAVVDLLEQLWWTPSLMTVDEWLDNQLRNVVRVSLATGGWSGNETLIDALDKSRFHLLYLGVKSSRRAARVYGPSDRVGDGQRARRGHRGERCRVARTGSGRWPVREFAGHLHQPPPPGTGAGWLM